MQRTTDEAVADRGGPTKNDDSSSQHAADGTSPALTSSEHYRALVENTSDVPYVMGADGRLQYLGRQFERYGIATADVLARGHLETIHPDDRERVAHNVEQSIASGEDFPTEFRILTGDGTVRWLEDRSRVRRDDEGQIVGLWGVLRDITERKQAEEALRASERRFRNLAEHSIDAIFTFDLSLGRVVYLSPSVERLTGYTAEEFSSGRGWDFRTRPDPKTMAQAYEQLLNDGLLEGFEIQIQRKDGTMATIEITASVATEGESTIAHGVLRDISVRRELEEQLRQMQKMDAIGQLAGGIAHDFNNLLTGILGYANMLKLQSAPGDRAHRAAEVIERAAERASALTQQLLDVARSGTLAETKVDLHEVVREVMTLLARTFDRRIEVAQQLDAEPSTVQGDAAQLQQVVLNLALNARDAMQSGGTLTVRTAVISLTEHEVQARAGLPAGCYIALSVSDTGSGIDEDIQHRIFEPFFTTKEKDAGTGMGLATVYGIVKHHGGTVQVHSEVERGSRFEILLPCVSGASSDSPPVSEPQPGHGMVLLVDDEEIVRTVTRNMLVELGYEVLTAESCREALELFRRRHTEIDLVIVDLSMREMGGVQCLAELRALDSEVAALLTTGMGLDEGAQQLVDEGQVGYLRKPYVLGQLSDAVREMLRDRGR